LLSSYFLQEDARIAEENAPQNSGDGDHAPVNDGFVRPPTPQCPPAFAGDHVEDAVFDKSPPLAEVFFFVFCNLFFYFFYSWAFVLFFVCVYELLHLLHLNFCFFIFICLVGK
jgi:hypothetical protein